MGFCDEAARALAGDGAVAAVDFEGETVDGVDAAKLEFESNHFTRFRVFDCDFTRAAF